MKETDIHNEIKDYINKYYGECWRANTGVFKNRYGKYVNTGLPKGFPDLFGIRKDGEVFFIEVKTPTGKLSDKQIEFGNKVKEYGLIYGVATSIEEADQILRKKIKEQTR